MKRIVVATALLVLVGFAGLVRADGRVVVPRDTRPFKVQQGDTVRITGKGIAGARIDAKVQGPAKIAATSDVTEVAAGRPVIGSNVKEFEVKPTGAGKVKVQVSVKNPTEDQPKVIEYEFDVE